MNEKVFSNTIHFLLPKRLHLEIFFIHINPLCKNRMGCKVPKHTIGPDIHCIIIIMFGRSVIQVISLKGRTTFEA